MNFAGISALSIFWFLIGGFAHFLCFGDSFDGSTTRKTISDGLKTWGSEDLLERIIDKRIGSLVEEKIRARINERLEKLKV